MADEPRREPVRSPVADLMNHFEFASLAEGTDPGIVQRICNRIMFGHPDGAAVYEEGGPARYEPAALAEVDGVLAQLQNREGLSGLDRASVRRVRGLLAGKNDDPGEAAAGYGGAI